MPAEEIEARKDTRILVIGKVQGKIRPLFEKISQYRNKIDLVFILGDLFDSKTSFRQDTIDDVDALIDGNITVDIMTYVVVGDSPLPPKVLQIVESSAGQLASNLVFLPKRCFLKISADGLTVVVLGGRLNPKTVGKMANNYTPYYSYDDARTLKGERNVDILITNDWPAAILTRSVYQSVEIDIKEQECIADLCSSLKPRYHFSSSDAFYQREPFVHSDSVSENTEYWMTHFISLADFQNEAGERSSFAFVHKPANAGPVLLSTISQTATSSPLSLVGSKRKAGASQESSHRFATETRHDRRANKRQKVPPVTTDTCFLCIASPRADTHLIVSVGDQVYLTLAKGPLITRKAFPLLHFPSHMLLIPLGHSPSIAAMSPDDRKVVYLEMQNYRRALQKMIAIKSNSQFGAITWEISRTTGIHAHWQFLPVPVEHIRGGTLEAAFKTQGEMDRYPKFQIRDVGDGSEEHTDFFRVLIWHRDDSGTDSERSLILPLDGSFRFDLQFGRKVMAKLLNLYDRADWKECEQTKSEEDADADAFKAAFEPFEASLAEESA
ncbi:hypothetical protein M501DRAFT_997857 [Patellaria atrata CBS 101060]|uniref:CwfJ domain-containing protein n=1 Tax=Patellaria atrata CBS 101060 TaxID=1346257 RepID=A0A9P4S4Z3_9PEZI|nr:hypothetical protein M501DRAFT_997857 [Patellaria atrata CBS 101060]